MNVALFSVCSRTGPCLKVDDVEKPIASRIPSEPQGISVRGCLRIQSPRHATAGTRR